MSTKPVVYDLSVTLLSMNDVAKMLSCTRQTVYNMIAEGQLERVYSRPGMPRITGSSYLAHLERIKTGSPASKENTAPRAAPKRSSAGATVLGWLGVKN